MHGAGGWLQPNMFHARVGRGMETGRHSRINGRLNSLFHSSSEPLLHLSLSLPLELLRRWIRGAEATILAFRICRVPHVYVCVWWGGGSMLSVGFVAEPLARFMHIITPCILQQGGMVHFSSKVDGVLRVIPVYLALVAHTTLKSFAFLLWGYT